MGWDSAAHPRAAAGAAGGGEFAAVSATGEGSQGKPKKGGGKGRSKAPRASHGSLTLHAGYGQKGGDKRVHALQAALNKLGLKGANGKPLALDGKLGPQTTAAIKAWQRKNGMKPTGTVTAAALKQLTSGKSRLKTAHLAAKKATTKRPGPRPATKAKTPAPKPAPRPRTVSSTGRPPTMAFTQ